MSNHRPRIVVIAATVDEGRAKYPDAAAIVTPRARDAARGIVADQLIVMASMRDHADLDEIRADAAPALATVRPIKTVETVASTGSARGLGGDAA